MNSCGTKPTVTAAYYNDASCTELRRMSLAAFHKLWFTIASAQLFSTFSELKWGTELFGPLLLTEEILTEPLRYENFALHLPQGPGLGVTLDWERIGRLRRDSKRGASVAMR